MLERSRGAVKPHLTSNAVVLHQSGSEKLAGESKNSNYGLPHGTLLSNWT